MNATIGSSIEEPAIEQCVEVLGVCWEQASIPNRTWVPNTAWDEVERLALNRLIAIFSAGLQPAGAGSEVGR